MACGSEGRPACGLRCARVGATSEGHEPRARARVQGRRAVNSGSKGGPERECQKIGTKNPQNSFIKGDGALAQILIFRFWRISDFEEEVSILWSGRVAPRAPPLWLLACFGIF